MGSPVSWRRRTSAASSATAPRSVRSEEHTSELQSLRHLVCSLLLEKKKSPAVWRMGLPRTTRGLPARALHALSGSSKPVLWSLVVTTRHDVHPNDVEV